MKISLLHNPSAGSAPSFEKVRRVLEDAGHAVVLEIEKDSDFERVVEKPVDFVVVAGGDGTVRKAARALAGSHLPLAILPLGTATAVRGCSRRSAAAAVVGLR